MSINKEIPLSTNELIQVDETRNRMKALAAVNNTFAQANVLFVASATARDPQLSEQRYQDAVSLTNRADSLAESYYGKYPNCLSRVSSPWAPE